MYSCGYHLLHHPDEYQDLKVYEFIRSYGLSVTPEILK